MGKESLMHNIRDFDIQHLRLDIAMGCKKLLGDSEAFKIHDTSAGAYAFYLWVCVLCHWYLCKKLLGDSEAFQVHDTSAGAYTFYLWVCVLCHWYLCKKLLGDSEAFKIHDTSAGAYTF